MKSFEIKLFIIFILRVRRPVRRPFIFPFNPIFINSFT